MANRVCGCCEEKARSRQTGGASKESRFASHFCGVKTSGAFAPPREKGWTHGGSGGARTQRTNAGPFSRPPHAWFCLFVLFVCLFAIFTVGPSVKSLLLVSNDPSASFLCYFCVLHLIFPSKLFLKAWWVQSRPVNPAWIQLGRTRAILSYWTYTNTPIFLEFFPYLFLRVFL